MRGNRDKGPTDTADGDLDRFHFDWVAVAIALVILAVIGMLTFEFWIPHHFLPRG